MLIPPILGLAQETPDGLYKRPVELFDLTIRGQLIRRRMALMDLKENYNILGADIRANLAIKLPYSNIKYNRK